MRVRFPMSCPSTQPITEHAKLWLARKYLERMPSVNMPSDTFEASYTIPINESDIEKGNYAETSHSEIISLPQNGLEPLLVNYTSQKRYRNRFDAMFLSFLQDEKTGKDESIIEKFTTKQKFLGPFTSICGWGT